MPARFAAARTSSARWRALADRIPPAELIDLVLHECAYGVELRGPRLAQARENLKKFRALLRRIQNRGYATFGRIASHLDRLAVGDESNASLDATNAVNLMTVHAAKGLEFPVVFVVNLARGTGNRRDYIRIGTEQSSGAASVAVGDFLSEYDEDAQAREREETKRLLYVALTRARDRLYLSSVVKDGRIAPGRGSLAEVLPPDLLDALCVRRRRGAGRVARRLRPCARVPRLPAPSRSGADAGSGASRRRRRAGRRSAAGRRTARRAPRRRRLPFVRRVRARRRASRATVRSDARDRRAPAAAGARHVG